MSYDEPDFNYDAIKKELSSVKTDRELFNRVVNTPFLVDKVNTALIFLGIIVLLIVNKKTATIDRIDLTSNDFAQAVLAVTTKRFDDIKVPLKQNNNIIAEAIRKQIPTRTTDWSKLFSPEMTKEQARINQASAGVACSFVYPLTAVKDGAALIFSFYQYPDMIGDTQRNFMEKYSAQAAEALRARIGS